MNPKISIITVVYNDVKNIEKSIQNTLSQTYQPLEFIIVDGASSDGTTEVIKKYDKYIKWVSEPDKGIYDAMNKGCRMATGEWVLFHNCGDYFISNTIVEDLFSNYEDNGEDFIVGNLRMVDSFFYYDVKPCILCMHYFKEMPFYHPATFVRMNTQRKYMFDTSYRNSADYDFCIRALLNGATYIHIDKIIATFNTSEGTSTDHWDITENENMRMLEYYNAPIEYIERRKKNLKKYLKGKQRKQYFIYNLWIQICKIIKVLIGRYSIDVHFILNKLEIKKV